MAKGNATAEAPPGAPGSVPEGMPGMGEGGDDLLSQQMAALTANSSGALGSEVDDMMAGLDLSKVSDGNFAVLTDGEYYEFWIKSVKPKKSQAGNKGLFMVLEVTEDYPEAGECIPDNVTLTELAMWRVKQLWKACDLITPESTFAGSGAADFVGCKIAGVIKNEPYNGKMGSKINGNIAVPEGGAGQRRAAGGGDAPAATASTPPGF